MLSGSEWLTSEWWGVGVNGMGFLCELLVNGMSGMECPTQLSA